MNAIFYSQSHTWKTLVQPSKLVVEFPSPFPQGDLVTLNIHTKYILLCSSHWECSGPLDLVRVLQAGSLCCWTHSGGSEKM